MRQFCTSLGSQKNAYLFTTVMRNNDCTPLLQSKPETAAWRFTTIDIIYCVCMCVCVCVMLSNPGYLRSDSS